MGVKPDLKVESVPILSFFTGAGFLDLGFMKSGFMPIWHNEYHQPFVKAFEFGMASVGHSGRVSKIQNTESIIDIGPNAILGEAFNNGPHPEIFGTIGGPPCPDFSVGGKNRGHLGDHGKLSEVYVNRIIELNPTFFVFENVPGLLRTTKHRAFLVRLLEKLLERYVVDLRVLNALDYGVPQDRERVFIIGYNRSWIKRQFAPGARARIENASEFVRSLNRIPVKRFFADMDHWFPWPENPEFKGAKYRYTWPDDPVPVGHTPKRPDCPEQLMVGTYICDMNRLKLANSDEGFTPKSSKFTQIMEGDVSRKSFKRLHRYRYSPAAAYGNNEVHLHPNEPRRLTVREALMIQSVPNEFALPPDLSLTDKFKTIGNGVPVKLASAVASAVTDFLNGGGYETI